MAILPRAAASVPGLASELNRRGPRAHAVNRGCPASRSARRAWLHSRMSRDATLDDLDALVEVENRCCDSDRLSRRNFRYLLTKGNAETVIDEEGGGIRGYAMLLFNTGTSLARMYS